MKRSYAIENYTVRKKVNGDEIILEYWKKIELIILLYKLS